MANNKTIFQQLTSFFGRGNGNPTMKNTKIYRIDTKKNNDIIFTSKDKAEYDSELALMKQQKLLSYQWAKSGYDTAMEQMQGATQVKIMYRDADLMDGWPEIGTALDIVAEESTILNKKGKILNIYSSSERIKAILEDLFVNKLDIHVMLPMISRAMCKYGNEYMLLNIDSKDGVIGWRELPVYDIRRIENGMLNQYAAMPNNNSLKPGEVQFVWEGHGESTPYFNWQIAHFRNIMDNTFLPYGASWLNKARRHWRMLSMMEDAMLLYRLEKSVERRIFKVNVGAIDDADVPAFLNDFMNSVKRAPIVDPQTGQVDLKKNFLDVSADYVIPVRSGQDPTDISTLQGAQNQTSMDDITYMENKVLSALKIPKSFLNFQDKDAKSQNMSAIDIRFSRTINKVQQALILELNKIAIIHLYILGFEDDLTNFTLSLNNPSNQLETLELTNLGNRLNAANQALAEQGGGIPLMSWRQTQKEIMGLSDEEIFDLLNEIRLEKAMAEEIANTSQIIRNTGMFRNVDRIYGEPNASYQPSQSEDEMGGGAIGGGGSFGGAIGGGGSFGDPMGGMDLGGMDDTMGDLGEPGASEEGSIGGEEGSVPMNDEMPMESVNRGKNGAFDDYLSYIKDATNKEKHTTIVDKAKLITESFKENFEKL